MKRSSSSLRDVRDEGSDRSHQLAIALAQICDPELLETLVHLKSALDEFGGEFRVVSMRHKYSPTGERLEDLTSDGEFFTDGYLTHYSHYAKDAPPEPNTELKDLHATGEDKLEAILAAMKTDETVDLVASESGLTAVPAGEES
jgi:hypothetical protein